MREVIEIHPFDVISPNLPEGVVVDILKIADPETPGGELLEIGGKLYRQTMRVPPLTPAGKEREEEVFTAMPLHWAKAFRNK